MQTPEPQKEHHWLQKLVGEWTTEMDCHPGPDQPATKIAVTEVVRSIGGLWVQCEGRGEMPGGPAMVNIMTLGYDPAKKRFRGTFIGSMMTHLWVYDGVLDAGGTVLTLDTEGPNFTDENKLVKYQDIIAWHSDDHRTLSSQALGEDGKWHPFLTAHYWRKK